MCTERAGSKYGLQRQSLPEILVASLRERILNGEFRDGDPLIQEAIAAEYECSRIPLREAFRQLEAEGLIVSKVHKGVTVTSLPPEQIMELFELRALLEPDILIHAFDNMTDEVLAEAETILVQLESAYRTRDIGKLGRLNWAFHRSLYAPSGRVRSLGLIQGINVQTDRYIRLQILLTSGFDDAEREHREILRLCRAKDKDVAPYLRDHIVKAGRNLLAALARHRAP